MTESSLPVVRASLQPLAVPLIISQAGTNASYAWDEFFSATIGNKHTRLAYSRAVKRFLAWLEPNGCELAQITPGMVGRYLDELTLSIPSKKLELAALRAFFDHMTVRHAIFINPASSVRGMRYSVFEGNTPEITPAQSPRLLDSIEPTTLLNLRDRAVLACLMFTAARAGAVASLTRGSLLHDGSQYRLRFAEKGGKRREIPVRHDLEQIIFAYLTEGELTEAASTTPLFRSGRGKRDELTTKSITGADICRMMKRRLAQAELPSSLSPHSFRVSVTCDLLGQNVPLEDVQMLLGHSDPRTTRLYDRRQRVVTRNLVERISVQ